MATVSEKRAAFRGLHEKGCFIIPNPWDVGSAKVLQEMGFEALASTSSGFASSLGLGDYGVSRDVLLAHLRDVAEAVDIPLNADFEGGYAVEPEGVAANVKLAMRTGVAGLSIEDRVVGGPPALLDETLAIERMRAARRAIDEDDPNGILVGRCESFLFGEKDVSKLIARLEVYAEAGADCLYPPGVREPADVAAVVKALAPKPINILLFPGMEARALADAGVRRISVGGGLARVARLAFVEAAEALKASL